LNNSSEKRKSIRKTHKVPIIVEELKNDSIYRGRLANYSENGIYFETDASLDLNATLYIKFEGPPNHASTIASSGTPENLLAKIRWKKETKKNYFNFGYGASIFNTESELDLNRKRFPIIKDLRKHPRKPYSKKVYFTSDNQYYQGSITDISKGGMFFKTQDSFSVGQTIRFVIPGTKIDNGVMLKAEIVRFNETGVGVKFNGLVKGITKQASQ
jgi:hypothetical protein